ncbi:MAG: ATP-grasp domain-containing protein [Bdellovibrionales bacterium]|nr:ATP-grasp domain-containing protein [Bdellovibrionales bacterium]
MRERIWVIFPSIFEKKGFEKWSRRNPDAQVEFKEFQGSRNPWTRSIIKTCDEWVEEARRLNPPVTAVLSFQDYPGCLAASYIADRLGLPGPRLPDLLKLSHKRLSRELQKKICPEFTPGFSKMIEGSGPSAFAFPFFAKPVKGLLSVRSKKIEQQADLEAYQRLTIRERFLFRFLMRPFHEFAANAGLKVSAREFIAESWVPGIQCTFEGYVTQTQAHPIGITDSHFYDGTESFSEFRFPSSLPRAVQKQISEASLKLAFESGLRSTLFNIEWRFDPKTQQLKIIEVNPRGASQFSDLYDSVLGVNSIDVAVALASGKDPKLPDTKKLQKIASSLVFRLFQDAKVKKGLGESDWDELSNLPGWIEGYPLYEEGKRLSRLPQDPDSFRYLAIHASFDQEPEIPAFRKALEEEWKKRIQFET